MALKVNGEDATPKALRVKEEVRNYLDVNAPKVEDVAHGLLMEALQRDSVKEDIKAIVVGAIPDRHPDELRVFHDPTSNSLITYVNGHAYKIKSLAKPSFWKRICGHE